jgi:hypothetical protein
MSWKSANAWMTENTTTTSVMGMSRGHVTCRNRFQPPAPSRAAASCSSGLMVWSPASRVMAKNGMPRHVLTTIAHQRAHVVSDRKGSLVVIRPMR